MTLKLFALVTVPLGVELFVTVIVPLLAPAGTVAVSFVADTGAAVLLPAADEGVAIEQQEDDGMLWAEARWNNR